MLAPLLALALFASPENPPPSVYRLSPAVDATVIVAAYGTALGLDLAADSLIQPSCPCDPATVNFIDRAAIGLHSDGASTASDVTVSVAVIAPVVIDFFALRFSHALLEDAVVYLEALAVNTFFVTLTKYIVQRPLPRTYAGDPDLVHSASGYRSFYSGHTSTAFAALSTAAITVQRRGGPAAIAWTIAILVGGSVAVERVRAGRHFWSDVGVGALAGTAVGFGVTALHGREGNLSVSGTSDGATLAWTTAF